MTGNRTGRDKQLREKTDSPNPRLQADHGLSEGPAVSPRLCRKYFPLVEKQRLHRHCYTDSPPSPRESTLPKNVFTNRRQTHTLYPRHPSQNENYFAGSHEHICNLLCNAPLLGSRAGHCLCHCLPGTSHHCSVPLAK